MSVVSISAEDEEPTCESCTRSCPLPIPECPSSPPPPFSAWRPPPRSSYNLISPLRQVPDIFLSLKERSHSKTSIESLLVHFANAIIQPSRFLLHLANTVHHSPDAETHGSRTNEPHGGTRHTNGQISLGTSDYSPSLPEPT